MSNPTIVKVFDIDRYLVKTVILCITLANFLDPKPLTADAFWPLKIESQFHPIIEESNVLKILNDLLSLGLVKASIAQKKDT